MANRVEADQIWVYSAQACASQQGNMTRHFSAGFYSESDHYENSLAMLFMFRAQNI